MSDVPKIEFPCRYPIKVIGEATTDTATTVLGIVRQHAPEVTPDDVSTRHSRKGNYVSVRVTIVAQSEIQLRALHQDLMAETAVRLVL